MKTYLPYIFTLICVSLFLWSSWSNGNEIKDLHEDIEIKNSTIDSLKNEIDTLNFELELWDFNMTNNTTHLLSAIIHVESSDNDSAYCLSEDAVGCLQIRKTMVNDVNRILKRQKSKQRFYYEDRWNRYKSIQMFDIFCNHYNLNSAEEISRCWNGGPRGINNPATVDYWAKVEKTIKENS